MEPIVKTGWDGGEIVTRELEEYGETIDGQWDLELVQIERSDGGVRCRFVADGDALLYEEGFGVGHLQRGCLRGDRITFGLANPVACSGRWQGRHLEKSCLVYARGGDSLELTLPAGSLIRVAILPGSCFEEGFERLTGLDARRVFAGGRNLLELPAESFRSLWNVWGAWLGGRAEVGPLADALLTSLASTVGHGIVTKGPDSEAGWRNFRRMVEHLESGEVPTGAGRLASDLGLSLRSLNEACWRSAGMPPGRFLKLVRLNRVRRDLIRESWVRRSVTSLAITQGFTELGRFAGEYRALFGELPSETLRRLHAAPAGRLG